MIKKSEVIEKFKFKTKKKILEDIDFAYKANSGIEKRNKRLYEIMNEKDEKISELEDEIKKLKKENEKNEKKDYEKLKK